MYSANIQSLPTKKVVLGECDLTHRGGAAVETRLMSETWMSSAPNHGNVTEPAGMPSKPVSIAGHVQQVFSHVKVENLVAGLSGGVVSTLVLHPLDLVKIRFAVFLYSYNAIKGYTKEGRQTELSPAEHLVSAAEAGILTLTITNPIWVTKTRLVLQYSADPTSKQYKGMVDALVKIYRYEGVPGLYKVRHQYIFGLPYTAVMRGINEGVMGFYKGIIPNLIRVTPACCITFVVYENVSRFLLGT
ncbi:hypothetical protein GOODEAATRI_000514 [Goodea atripinnis]|uniref:Mitochondrial carrier protein n=1 Tax=Goodea atripinnis TaxID=208336 RepID=A0ABV0MN81_9TELE